MKKITNAEFIQPTKNELLLRRKYDAIIEKNKTLVLQARLVRNLYAKENLKLVVAKQEIHRLIKKSDCWVEEKAEWLLYSEKIKAHIVSLEKELSQKNKEFDDIKVKLMQETIKISQIHRLNESELKSVRDSVHLSYQRKMMIAQRNGEKLTDCHRLLRSIEKLNPDEHSSEMINFCKKSINLAKILDKHAEAMSKV